ncbi:hypothetical protein SISNIDRAFT_207132 [Sistotremastrum niveocremeum HHB9708]|uniref:Uncharacterized protein n=1 Tax=Sistotremastrum niveocremeum HHB9708 TaxID=1314777 RepID=A0A164ZUH3_9AGAM|nr:hypothetical protein SISNIDRAFT_207132 [Sistotremastrum niveocremeum HHB9708]
MANMTAAEALKADMSALKPLKPTNGKSPSKFTTPAKPAPPPPVEPSPTQPVEEEEDSDMGIPGFGVLPEPPMPVSTETPEADVSVDSLPVAENDAEDSRMSSNGPGDEPDTSIDAGSNIDSPRGVKRSIGEANSADESFVSAADDDDAPPSAEAATTLARVVHKDGTVEQEDTIKSVIF